MKVSDSLIKPMRPTGHGWVGGEDMSHLLGWPTEAWFHREHLLQVFSAVEVASDKEGIGPAEPHYHISVSRLVRDHQPERCTLSHAMWALAQFNLSEAIEDNHVPDGKVRNFWRPVADPLVGKECVCVAEEVAVVEGDYVWRP